MGPDVTCIGHFVPVGDAQAKSVKVVEALHRHEVQHF